MANTVQSRNRLFAHLGWDPEEELDTAIREFNDELLATKEREEGE